MTSIVYLFSLFYIAQGDGEELDDTEENRGSITQKLLAIMVVFLDGEVRLTVEQVVLCIEVPLPNMGCCDRARY